MTDNVSPISGRAPRNSSLENATQRTIDAFMQGLSNSFDAVFARPDIAETMLDFMQGDVVFVVTRNELQVRRLAEDTPTPPPAPTGMYL